jgi:hypothetical protein
MIDQITVFLENAEGRLAALCRTLSDAGLNMSALTIADTADYGVVRIICDNPEKAIKALGAADFRAVVTKVSAIQVPNRPGGLSDLLGVLDELDLNIEYGYCFSLKGETAVDVFKIRGAAEQAAAVFKLEEAGFKVLTSDDLK